MTTNLLILLAELHAQSIDVEYALDPELHLPTVYVTGNLESTPPELKSDLDRQWRELTAALADEGANS